MQRILYLISVVTYCKFTVPLVKHCVITNVWKYLPSHVDGMSRRYTGDDGVRELDICLGIKRR